MGTEEKTKGEFVAVMTVARTSGEPDVKTGLPCRRLKLSGTSSFASCVWLEMLVQGPGAEIFCDSLQAGDGYDMALTLTEIGGDEFGRHARRMVARSNAERDEAAAPLAVLGKLAENVDQNFRAFAMAYAGATEESRALTEEALAPVFAAAERIVALRPKPKAPEGDDAWKHGPGFEVRDAGRHRNLHFEVGGESHWVSGSNVAVFELAAVLRLQQRRIAALEAKVAKATEDAKTAAVAAKEVHTAVRILRQEGKDAMGESEYEAICQIELAMADFEGAAAGLAAELGAPEVLP